MTQKSLLDPPAPKAPGRMTRTPIERYLELEERRKELARESAQLKREQDEIAKQQLIPYIRAKAAGKELMVKTCGYVLQLVTKAGSVSWKSELVKRIGKVEAAKLEAAAPVRQVLEVVKAA